MQLGQTMNKSNRTLKQIIQNLPKIFAIARQKTGITIKEIASLLGISEKRIRRFENGSLIPSLPEVELLGFLIGVPLHSLTEQEDAVSIPKRSEPRKVQLLKQVRDKVIGTSIQLRRQAMKMNLKELSNQTQIPISRLKRYELGEVSIPLNELDFLCTALQLDYSTLIDQQSPVGIWHNEQKRIYGFLQLPQEMQDFLVNKENLAFLESAMRIKQTGIDNLDAALKSQDNFPPLKLEED